MRRFCILSQGYILAFTLRQCETSRGSSSRKLVALIDSTCLPTNRGMTLASVLEFRMFNIVVIVSTSVTIHEHHTFISHFNIIFTSVFHFQLVSVMANQITDSKDLSKYICILPSKTQHMYINTVMKYQLHQGYMFRL